MYACKPEDVGSRIAIDAGGERLLGTIDESFVSQVKDQDDRVARTESYEKAFTPLAVGKIKLAVGRQVLRIAALHKAGAEVMELRAIGLQLAVD